MTHQPKIGIAAIFKNEAPYVIEWLAHHRLMGINRFFIADNESTDGTTELLEALQHHGYVDLIHFTTQPGLTPQMPAYAELMLQFGNQVDWIGFIDADEFIWPTGNEHSLASYLSSVVKENPSIGSLILNWACYGSSKKARYSPEPVTSRFTWRAYQNHPLNHNQKFFVRPHAFSSPNGPHHCHLHSGFEHRQSDLSLYEQKEDANYPMAAQVIWDHFRLNHYIIKSHEEYIYKKSARGSSHANDAMDRIYFVDRDENEECEIPNLKYCEELDREIAKILKSIDRTEKIEKYAIYKITPTNHSILEIPIVGCIDKLELKNGDLTIEGWALIWKQDTIAGIQIQLGQQQIKITNIIKHQRSDVLPHYPFASHFSGFSAKITIKLNSDDHVPILIRALTKCGEITEPITLPTAWESGFWTP